MLALLIIPWFLFVEINYLFKHPWTFNLTAALVWAVITGFSALFVADDWRLGLVPVIHAAAVGVYYILKINLNRRRPAVMKLHHQHYYGGAHHHKQKYRNLKRPGDAFAPGPRRYHTPKEIVEIIKKITSP